MKQTIHRRTALRLGGTTLIATTLAACGFTRGSASAPQPTPVRVQPTAAHQPTAQPSIPTAQPGATNAPPAATVRPAPMPTSMPAPTSTPAPVALLGPEWRVLVNGDPYNTGVETAIAYLPPTMPVANLPEQDGPYTALAEQAVIVQRNSAGQPWVRTLVFLRGVVRGGAGTPEHPQGGPNDRTAALRLAIGDPGVSLRVLPIDSDNKPAAQGLVFSYNSAIDAITMEPIATPEDEAWPGAEWQPVTQGDFNNDGIVEQVYYRPSSISPDASFGGASYAAYTLVADAVLIGQTVHGAHQTLAVIDQRGVQTDTLLTTLSTPNAPPERRPAAFLLAAPLDATTPLAAIPLNAAGAGYTQGFALGWDTSAAAYRIIGPPASQ